MIFSPGSNSLYAYCALSRGKMCTERSVLWSVMISVLLFSADAQDSNGPVIVIPNENETILQSGQNYTLSCRGKLPVKFEQQELPEENVGGFYKESRFSKKDSEYFVELDLFNVDRFAVGYYACYYDTADTTKILKDIVEEPKNSEHVAYTYIYVNDSTLVAPVRAFARVQVGSKYLIECKPTAPDINVTLIVPQSNSPAKKVKYNPKIGFVFSNIPRQAKKGYFCRLQRGSETSTIAMPSSAGSELGKPTIDGGDRRFLAGETFTINCTVPKPDGEPIDLQWMYPETANESKIKTSSNRNHKLSGNAILYENITIINASENESGSYYCLCNNKTHDIFVKEYLENAVLDVTARPQSTTDYAINKGGSIVRIIGETVDAYPEPTVTMFRDNTPINIDGKKYTYSILSDKYIFTIHNKSFSDTGKYYMKYSNGYLEKTVEFVVNIIGPPKIDTLTGTARRCVKGVQCSYKCEALGLPVPNYKWEFTDESGRIATLENSRSVKIENAMVNGLKYKTFSRITLPVNLSGNLTCTASNAEGTDSAVQTILVNEIHGGFGILNSSNTWFSEGDPVSLTCLVSLYDFTNVTWLDENGDEVSEVQLSQNDLSIIARVTMDPITVENEGTYSCVAKRFNGSEQHQDITITVAGKRPLKFLGPETETQHVNLIDKVNMTCVADAVPPPTVEWYKDGSPVEFDNDKISNNIRITNRTTVSSTINIYPMHNEFAGVYECRNKNGEQQKTYTLILNDGTIYRNRIYISVFSILFLFLILMIVYLTWKIRKEKQFKRELAAAGLLHFKKGLTASINPELGIDEQAELLPYDERFEFPAERLSIGKQLGAGAFGVVYKAEARGIINAEETTTVAVKTVKKTADNMYIKALASELKIMVHLGKHINIVNLLGACTKKVGKRELIVIVEYCKFGNIHNYLQKHREVFIDQLNDNTEKILGKVNRAYSSSSGNTAISSDYFGSNHTQDTDNTLLNTANSNRSGRKDDKNLKESLNKEADSTKVSEAGYVQPEWRSNYESDYFDGRCPRPLCSRDLLAWSFQVARGMEYLASKKILHGDLAARNILLAEDNVVKICDFGLARSIYKNDEYQKKGNSLLPVKWLAIECVTDQIFSTQSDVWSFGIVLWEIFSLAKTPYPNLSPASLLPRLVNGYRLEKPAYANDKLYDVMRQCWHQKPTSRPSFTQLQEILGSFLEDNVRDHYVDLNATYMDMNKKQDGEDYLAMVSAPDYNNLLTPSPHHYANDANRFFPVTPTQLQHDDEGYLQVSPASQQTLFNARQGTKLVCDGRTPRASDANSYSSESTPMLIFNGSESDHENVSPYMNMCTKITEEPDDEVFKTKENNAKNIQPVIRSVDNPSYITPGDIQKQQNFTNNYTNVTKPNGLVK